MLNFLTYRLFRSRKWNHMSVSGRQKALQRLEYIESKRLGREELSINIVTMPENMLGQCDYKGKVIYLNEKLLSTPNMQFIAMITLFHEGRHAYQYSVVSNKKHISRFSKAYKWKQNMQNYIRYDGHDKFSYYSMQEVERDTNMYSLERLKSLHFWYRKEDAYFATLQFKIDEMEREKTLARKELGLFYKWKVDRKVKNKKS